MWSRRRTDQDFQSEIESPIQLEADRLMAEGAPPAEAQAAARRAFGCVVACFSAYPPARRASTVPPSEALRHL